MKGTKLIGIGLAVLGLAFGAMADVQTDLDAAMAAYREIKGDVAKAAQVQEMYEAIPNNPYALNMLACCLNIQGKRDEAIAAWQSALKIQKDISAALCIQANIASTRLVEAIYGKNGQNMGLLQSAMAELKAAIDASPQANAGSKVLALSVYANGLTKLGKHAEASQARIELVLLRVVTTKTADEIVTREFGNIRPDVLTADAYRTGLSDILKATPATEANAEFLGRVKSELEKMK